MSDPVRTPPFAPFEWLLSARYLRARRKRRIHFGHRRLFVSRHHARRRHAHHRHGGDEWIPQGTARQDSRPQRPSPGAAAGNPADRLEGGRRAHQSRSGHQARGPIVEGQALASSPFNAAGVLGARHPRRRSRTSSRRSPRTSSKARSKASMRARASRSGAVSPISSRCVPATASRWWRRAAR